MKGQESDPVINEVSLASILGVPHAVTIHVGKPKDAKHLDKKVFRMRVRKKNPKPGPE